MREATRERFDVAVVGGRVAGSSAAAHLARAGLSVLLLERADSPGEILSTHTMQDLDCLDRLGVLERVLATGPPPMPRSTLWMDDCDLSVGHPEQPWLSVRRATLDGLLLETARRAGAEVRLGCKVTGLLRDGRDERVHGLRYTGPDGREVTVSSRLVVGADGRSSTVAKLTGARKYHQSWNERGAVWRYFEGLPAPPEFFFCRRGDDLLLAAPCDRGRVLLAVQPAVEDASRYRADGEIERTFRRAARPWGRDGHEWSDLLAHAEPDGAARMVLRYACFFRESAGPGWVLLGDAGHVKDVVTGQGICDAMRHAERLTARVMPAWRSDRALDAATRTWWHARDRDAAPMYWLSQDMGRAGVSPALFGSFFQRIAASERRKLRLQEVLGRRYPVRRFIAPYRFAAAIAARLRSGAAPAGATLREAGALVRTEALRRWAAVRPHYEQGGARPAQQDGPRAGQQGSPRDRRQDGRLGGTEPGREERARPGERRPARTGGDGGGSRAAVPAAGKTTAQKGGGDGDDRGADPYRAARTGGVRAHRAAGPASPVAEGSDE
ncbi:FAD-dependent oxidoreductase [Streptomyces cacaoi]|uniref:FAD-dependent oxidoreductase n=1 Tax=Streptomyces cacaoi TaxID=1898 RepID=UPI0037479EF8